MPLDIPFSRRDTEPCQVSNDELEVLSLTRRGLAWLCEATPLAVGPKCDCKLVVTRVDGEPGSVGEVHDDRAAGSPVEVRHTASSDKSRNRICVHAEPLFGVPAGEASISDWQQQR